MPCIENPENGTFLVPFTFRGEVLYATFDLSEKRRVLSIIGNDRRLMYRQATQCFLKSRYSFIYPCVWDKECPTKMVRIFRILLGISDPLIFADHKNGDTLDNRMSNLRTANRNQNNFNCTKRAGTSSLYKGVSWITRQQMWKAQIWHYKKRYGLGVFHSEVEAAKAYNKKCRELFGEFAKLNEIKE